MSTQASVALDAWARLLRGHASVRRALNGDLVAQHGLTINDYEALLRLARADENLMRRVDLAAELLLTPSGVTRLLEGLERAGLVAKATCTSDARVTYAVLTAEGRRKLEDASSSHLTAVRAVFEDRFSEDELATLAELLGRLPGAGAANGADCSP